MNKKFYLLLVVFMGFWHHVSAQTGFGEIRGKVRDEKGKPVDYALVVAKLEGVAKRSTYTDDEGNYVLRPLDPGTYSIEVQFPGYEGDTTRGIVLSPDQIRFINVEIAPKGTLRLVIKKDSKNAVPLIDPGGKQGIGLTAAQVMRMPNRNINQLANLAAGVISVNGGTPTFRGARADGTAYYIDGVRVIGSAGVPTNMIDQIQVITSGVPAQYGDYTGGAISIRTKGPSKYLHGGAELITSTPFDAYNFNQLEMYAQGPILKKDKGDRDKERSLLGFSLGANLGYTKDPSPSAIGVWKAKDNVLSNLEKNPLRIAPGGTGFVPNAEFVTKSDLEKVDAKLNIPRKSFSITGSLNYQPSKNINIVFGGQANYVNALGYSYSSSLFNFKENPQTIDGTYRTYLRFTQTFTNDNKEKDKFYPISNAFYTVRFDYTYRQIVQQDPDLKDDFFKYGYVGKFKTYQSAFYNTYNPGVNGTPKKFIDQNGDTVLLSYFQEHVANVDTLYTFERSDINAIRANYTQNLYELIASQGGKISSINTVRQNLGLVNGDNPQAIYSLMWSNPGTPLTNYSKASVEQFTLYAMGEASINSKRNKGRQHSLQFGLQYEQRVQRSYGVSAIQLWGLARQLMNNQFNAGLANQADANGYYRGFLVYDANGVFQDTVRYDRSFNGADQSYFDKTFRSELIARGERDVYGNLINQQSFIDVNSYSPNDFNINMFSADELLNNGNSYVNYYGYDAYGNKVKGKPGYDRFLNGERLIPAYMPIYQAAWLQDQFIFRDLIFRIGVRLERFDNNMPVLKDPFTLYPVKTAGEVSEIGNNQVTHPSTIGSNYAVYVDDVKNPTKILGYRDGINWYNAEGSRINDPSVLANATTSGRIQPYLVDPNNQVITTTGTFKDYQPQINVLPRVWFSFPINEKAQFFATYDILTQRPTEGTIAQVDDYYYMQNRANSTIGNPDLKPTRRTDYELGFKQALGSDADGNANQALTIAASYSEMRNLITQYRYNQAYPITYTTFGNLDFSTVKSLRFEYELRDLGNVSLMANYALQFADGTGSNSGSSGALLAVGLPNLRTLFPLDYDVRHIIKGTVDFHYKGYDKDAKRNQYNGPIVFNKPIFQNAGIALIFNSQSGRPYTVNSQATPDAQPGVVVRSPIKGNPNGSRLPWQFYTDLNIDKTFYFKAGTYKNGAPKQASIVVFMQITNLFNAKNVLGVYRYSGSADNDGYLNSPAGQVAINQATNAQSFIDLYNIKVANPGNYALPRWTRLGVRYNF